MIDEEHKPTFKYVDPPSQELMELAIKIAFEGGLFKEFKYIDPALYLPSKKKNKKKDKGDK
jgi:hypothetical protein